MATYIDDLLSDLDQANYRNERDPMNLSKASSSSFSSSSTTNNRSSSNNNNINFIDSINRLVQSHEAKGNNKNSGLTSDDINTTDSDINSEEDIGDLTELDNLLEDLYLARKELQTDKKPQVVTNPAGFKVHRDSRLIDMSLSPSSLSPSSASASPKSSSTSTSSETKLQASRELESLMSALSMYKMPEARPDARNHQSAEKISTTTTTKNGKDKAPSALFKNVCRACAGPINGQVITAMGFLWHPEHFQCSHCNCNIGTSIFYEKDERPYCERDYLQLFSPKCAACTMPILDKMLTALNQSWHLKCFACKSCAKPLNDESFLEINSSAYCKDCYVTDLAPKCKRCAQPIVENFISALDAYFHPSCFVCVECGVAFNATSFYEYQNMPYCELHYHLKRGSLCNSCSQPINGRCITALNKKYHPEHFNCSFCLQTLNKGTFKTCPNEKPYCHQCFQKLFPI